MYTVFRIALHDRRKQNKKNVECSRRSKTRHSPRLGLRESADLTAHAAHVSDNRGPTKVPANRTKAPNNAKALLAPLSARKTHLQQGQHSTPAALSLLVTNLNHAYSILHRPQHPHCTVRRPRSPAPPQGDGRGIRSQGGLQGDQGDARGTREPRKRSPRKRRIISKDCVNQSTIASYCDAV